ncbi:hypothetical protein CPSG_02882 [Coccidioides posadasii str. Silveira]|uniref:Uncharacterized protein n=1 Tax=Coccidioides posadasii (strain RMSCC 757 / Silveira) TaxID=443226 RepID=E9CYL2_COCPS|nr:hypothetical protein CPSG_02882 [Coccidioides posadasii str. Silveira]
MASPRTFQFYKTGMRVDCTPYGETTPQERYFSRQEHASPPTTPPRRSVQASSFIRWTMFRPLLVEGSQLGRFPEFQQG